MNSDTTITERPEDPGHMPEVRKYLFENNFDDEGKPAQEVEEEIEEAEPEEVVPSFSEEEMAAARDDAFAKGKAEGVGEAAEATERNIVNALASLEGQFEKLFQDHEKSQESNLDIAISVGVAISRKVFPALNEQNGLGEIERMIVMSMKNILDEPGVTVYVHPGNAAILEDRLGGLSKKASYKGEIKIVSSDEISPGDCRVEWSGGGAERDMTEMWRKIDEIVERNLSAIAESTPEDKASPEPSENLPEDAPAATGGEDTATDPEDT